MIRCGGGAATSLPQPPAATVEAAVVVAAAVVTVAAAVVAMTAIVPEEAVVPAAEILPATAAIACVLPARRGTLSHTCCSTQITQKITSIKAMTLQDRHRDYTRYKCKLYETRY